jgi:hypothetical protein
MTNTEAAYDYNLALLNRSAALDVLIGLSEGVANSTDALNMLGAVRLVELAANQARRAIVDEARAGGFTWAEIGDALGVSRQAAHERFGR